MAALKFVAVLTISAGAVMSVVTTVSTQWLNHPVPGIPRTADGKADLFAPAPRTSDGRPDLSGVWRPPFGANAVMTEGASFQPWAEAISRERLAANLKDMPRARCLPLGMPMMLISPFPVKLMQTAGALLALYEAESTFRQVFLDARQLPQDPQPTWRGYSVGRWEADELVVETSAEWSTWLDGRGHPTTETLRTERYGVETWVI